MKKFTDIARRATWAALVIVIMTASASPAQQQSDVVTVNVVGSSHIWRDDMSAGRARAIENGLVAAAYQVLAGFLPADAFTAGFQSINMAVFGNTDNFINNYKVLNESQDKQTYRLLIQASVSVQRLKDALKTAGISTDHDKLPRVLLCLAEKPVDQDSYHYWWSASPSARSTVTHDVLAQLLAADQLILIQPEAGLADDVQEWNLSAPQAVSLGRRFDADVVVAGAAVSEPAPNTMDGELLSFRGAIRLAAYRVSDGEQIAQTQSSALAAAKDSVGGSREALHRAAEQCAREISRLIRDAWRSAGADQSRLVLQVAGIRGNMASFVKFRGIISTLSGVNSIQLKEMTTDEAVLLVSYQGNARSLADALLVQNFDTYAIHISEVTHNQIRLQLIPR